MSEFSCILTDVGRALFANAQLTGDAVLITHIAVGDADGLPDQSRNTLRNEVWRDEVTRRALSPADDTVLEVEGYIAPEDGGFTIREAGLFNENGDMVAMANMPETYKPTLASGSGIETQIRLIMHVGNADDITLKLNPAIIMASRTWVEETVQHPTILALQARVMAMTNAVAIDQLIQTHQNGAA